VLPDIELPILGCIGYRKGAEAEGHLRALKTLADEDLLDLPQPLADRVPVDAQATGGKYLIVPGRLQSFQDAPLFGSQFFARFGECDGHGHCEPKPASTLARGIATESSIFVFSFASSGVKRGENVWDSITANPSTWVRFE